MNKIDVGQTINILANIGVIAGIAFLAFELRQNTISARATAFQQLGIATSEIWYSMARDRELNDLVTGPESTEDYFNLSESDRRLIQSYTVGNLRLFETVYLQVEQGLLDQCIADARLGAICGEQHVTASHLARDKQFGHSDLCGVPRRFRIRFEIGCSVTHFLTACGRSLPFRFIV